MSMMNWTSVEILHFSYEVSHRIRCGQIKILVILNLQFQVNGKSAGEVTVIISEYPLYLLLAGMKMIKNDHISILERPIGLIKMRMLSFL